VTATIFLGNSGKRKYRDAFRIYEKRFNRGSVPRYPCAPSQLKLMLRQREGSMSIKTLSADS